MTFLPIVERELRAGARKVGPRYVRLGVAAVALLIGLFQIAFIPMMSRGGASGSMAFNVMTGYAFLLCIGAGIFVTADCLSEEKREGTLGLLFLTDLRGYDVVLGKLASQVVYLGYALLAIIPGAALPLLLGGITAGELWRISLALMNLLFCSLAAGIFASSVCREAGRAMLLTAALIAFLCLVLPLLQAALNSAGPSPAGLWFGWASPSVAYLQAMESAYLSAGGHFWIALLGSHAIAWLLISSASTILPRSWQDRSVSSPAPAILPPADPGVSEAAFTPRATRNRKLLEEDPLLWLIGERKGLQSAVWALCVLWVGVVVLFGVIAPLVMGVESFVSLAVIGWVGLLITKILFTTEACRFFAETRRAGSFELLLAAPINANRFVSAQWTALRRVFGPPLLTVGCATLLAIGVSALIQGNDLGDIFAITAFGGVATGFALAVEALDFLALGWLGMWLSLTMRRPQLAAGATILYVLILPGVTTCYAIFVGFILDIILIAVFASKLHADFRLTLMNRPLLARAEPGSRN